MDYAVIKLKRRADAPPVESLVVSYKKAKLDNPSSSFSSEQEIASFVKTIESEGDSNSVLSDVLKKKDAKRAVEEGIEESITVPNPKKVKLINLDEKFKLSDETCIEEAVTCNDEMLRPTYVYDLYLWKSSAAAEGNLNDISAFPSEYRDFLHENESDKEYHTDDSDSNSESNWRNDYPDEDAFADYTGNDGEESENDASNDSSNEEKDRQGSELRKIKRRYAKILKMMKNDASSFNYHDFFN